MPTSTLILSQKVGDEVVWARWKVKVTKVETAHEYDDYYFPEGSKSYMVILTVEYTYLGSEKTNIYPESVILTNMGNNDTFIYEIPIANKEFIFHFPETIPIEIQVKESLTSQ